jgi:hypothetical protein
MLARRLLLLVGVLIGVGGLYLREIETDASLIQAIGGSGLPTIWQSFSGGERIGVVIGVGLLVAVAYRPRLRRVWDRLAVIAGGLLAGAAVVILLFAYRDAQRAASSLGELLDLAVFSDLIPESPGARAGWGFFVSIAGFVIVGVASVWDLFAPRPPDRPVPKRPTGKAGGARGKGPAPKASGAPPGRPRPRPQGVGTGSAPRQTPPATSARGTPPGRGRSNREPPPGRGTGPQQRQARPAGPADAPPRSVEEADDPAVEGGDPDQ